MLSELLKGGNQMFVELDEMMNGNAIREGENGYSSSEESSSRLIDSSNVKNEVNGRNRKKKDKDVGNNPGSIEETLDGLKREYAMDEFISNHVGDKRKKKRMDDFNSTSEDDTGSEECTPCYIEITELNLIKKKMNEMMKNARKQALSPKVISRRSSRENSPDKDQNSKEKVEEMNRSSSLLDQLRMNNRELVELRKSSSDNMIKIKSWRDKINESFEHPNPDEPSDEFSQEYEEEELDDGKGDEDDDNEEEKETSSSEESPEEINNEDEGKRNERHDDLLPLRDHPEKSQSRSREQEQQEQQQEEEEEEEDLLRKLKRDCEAMENEIMSLSRSSIRKEERIRKEELVDHLIRTTSANRNVSEEEEEDLDLDEDEEDEGKSIHKTSEMERLKGFVALRDQLSENIRKMKETERKKKKKSERKIKRVKGQRRRISSSSPTYSLSSDDDDGQNKVSVVDYEKKRRFVREIYNQRRSSQRVKKKKKKKDRNTQQFDEENNLMMNFLKDETERRRESTASTTTSTDISYIYPNEDKRRTSRMKIVPEEEEKIRRKSNGFDGRRRKKKKKIRNFDLLQNRSLPVFLTSASPMRQSYEKKRSEEAKRYRRRRRSRNRNKSFDKSIGYKKKSRSRSRRRRKSRKKGYIDINDNSLTFKGWRERELDETVRYRLNKSQEILDQFKYKLDLIDQSLAKDL